MGVRRKRLGCQGVRCVEQEAEGRPGGFGVRLPGETRGVHRIRHAHWHIHGWAPEIQGGHGDHAELTHGRDGMDTGTFA